MDDRLPNADRARFPMDKITRYLFQPESPAGWAKGRFFLRFGFALDRPEALREALLEHARTQPSRFDRLTAFGSIWHVRGIIETPDGRNPHITSVWQFDFGDEVPKFITVTLKRGQP